MVRQANDELDNDIASTYIPPDAHLSFLPNPDSDFSTPAQTPTIDEPIDETTALFEPMSYPHPGARFESYCPLENSFYPGQVDSVSTTSIHSVQYGDGNTETFELSSETWCYPSTSGSTAGFVELQSSSPSDLSLLFQHFWNKLFMAHQA